ncbi:MAG TPA: cysteine peptidase family C39 domain-containing protein [Patescibacteria group bacterium]|nr:cysteine peptidase family C39 domain-containing protein [Patescibacteria group bacterium]
MLKIPYIKQPDDNSCALACYTMVAKYFFPEVSLEEIAKISDWEEGYVVWAFKFWLWIMGRGIKITDYDLLDAKTWARDGLEGLKKSVSEKEFNFYINNTKDINSYSHDIKKVLTNHNFFFFRQKPTFETLEKSINENKICEVVLDAGTLSGQNFFSLHRVVVLEVDDNKIIFHDPANKPNVEIGKDLFVKAWLEAVSEPELCIYTR